MALGLAYVLIPVAEDLDGDLVGLELRERLLEELEGLLVGRGGDDSAVGALAQGARDLQGDVLLQGALVLGVDSGGGDREGL